MRLRASHELKLMTYNSWRFVPRFYTPSEANESHWLFWCWIDISDRETKGLRRNGDHCSRSTFVYFNGVTRKHTQTSVINIYAFGAKYMYKSAYLHLYQHTWSRLPLFFAFQPFDSIFVRV